MRSHTPELLEVEAEWQPESSKPALRTADFFAAVDASRN